MDQGAVVTSLVKCVCADKELVIKQLASAFSSTRVALSASTSRGATRRACSANAVNRDLPSTRSRVPSTVQCTLVHGSLDKRGN